MRLAVFIATPALLATVMSFHEAPVAQPQLAPTDIGGVVSSVNGAEAGVWVIAETNDLPTKFAKIVVTDDRGRYLIPELPKARYTVWARGYGLVDSHKVPATPGTALNLQARVAPSAAAAAEYHPAIYWYSMLRAPLPAEFPGTGPDGNGINPALKSQDQWLDIAKTNGCYGCHAAGHKANQVKMLVRDPATPSSKNAPMLPSPFWGEERIWDSQTSMHNPMLDEKGRVWFTSRVRPPANPDFCKKGSDHPSAKLFPVESANRHLSMYDPKSGRITLISTCFPTHHLVFAEDANHTLWTSAGGPGSGVLGWLNRKMFDETGDEVRSQGWTALVLDTNGNGKRDDYVEPNQPVDPAKDKRIVAAFYGIAVNPADGTIWGSVLGFPGHVIRVNPGPDPAATALAEVFEPPLPGYGPRGMDIDRNGVVWAPLSSGHLASFDRRLCKGPLNGPTATGQHCPEGWTLYPFPGPQLRGVTESGSAEASYYAWVDQFDTFGLGRNVPLATGNANESLIALVNGTFGQ